MTTPPLSSASSVTAHDRDVESQTPTKVSHFKLLTDQAGVTPEVLSYPYSGHGSAESPYLVDFIPNDPYNPIGFSNSKKWTITLIQAAATFTVAFSSSVYTGGVIDILQEFKVSHEVVILGVSFFVLGFAVGPMIWAPMSELFGRQVVFFFTYMALTAFNAAAAGAPNMGALVVFRFFAGAFGASPLTNCGGVIADMFSANSRGIAGSIFAMAPFLGPAIGPIVGGFLGENEGWRWVEGLTAILTGVLWFLSTVVYQETYVPVILQKRAAALSKQTGKVYTSKLDAGKPSQSVGTKFVAALSRPWVLLFREPIVLLSSIYIAIIYGTLYMCFAAFPIVFQIGRGWSPGIGGLAFVGIAVGVIAGTSFLVYDNKRYSAIADASPGGMAPPEARLKPGIIGSVLLPIGLFWFAWTNGTNIHWIVPIIGSAFFACGLIMVFLGLLNYLIDSYVVFAASVLAANSILRSLFGAAFPLFTTYMYENLGNHWASSIPAFLTLLCLPFPFFFYKYGERMRKSGKYSAEAAAILEHMRSSSAAAQKGFGATMPEPLTETEAMEQADELQREKTRELQREKTREAST